MTAELALLSICTLLFRVVIQSRRTGWYKTAVRLQVSTNVFAGIQNENIFAVLAVAVGFVVLFAVISVCIVRRLQLEQMRKQLGMFLTCGYTRGKVVRMLGIDSGIDLLVAVPFSLVLADKLLDVLRQKEEFLVIFSAMDVNAALLGQVVVACVLGLYAVIAGYESLWMRRCVKGGLAPVIRQDG